MIDRLVNPPHLRSIIMCCWRTFMETVSPLQSAPSITSLDIASSLYKSKLGVDKQGCYTVIKISNYYIKKLTLTSIANRNIHHLWCPFLDWILRITNLSIAAFIKNFITSRVVSPRTHSTRIVILSLSTKLVVRHPKSGHGIIKGILLTGGGILVYLFMFPSCSHSWSRLPCHQLASAY